MCLNIVNYSFGALQIRCTSDNLLVAISGACLVRRHGHRVTGVGPTMLTRDEAVLREVSYGLLATSILGGGRIGLVAIRG